MDEAKRLVVQSTGTFRPEFLEAASHREILLRMLRNLKGMYAHHEEWARSLTWVNLILELDPSIPEERRDRAIILEKLDCFRAAAEDYQAYLSMQPQAEDVQQIGQRLHRARANAQRLH